MESCTFIEDINDAASSSRALPGSPLFLRAILLVTVRDKAVNKRWEINNRETTSLKRIIPMYRHGQMEINATLFGNLSSCQDDELQ